ncbi:MAG: Lead, cadmium, zinc and mercury transporting ATPase; Copper-translocating P-type ATPase [uncultured Rubrobacteraceae bacterium]|uniref:Lead, cadmium, zinc and mercury transporting ATPase Copper-translocating P-type ATPase n=1 Tax=uncultured Rubrobacteraceae bacterium TaxID=349277 RepID=A0A6J4RYA4_9ACTN|nr:MAG: Lead, cadmium, zinc and mercury transporting ATPase; Copper-translocating P-type ATPase [uncultured Rubrobacteraceae bacterium]
MSRPKKMLPVLGQEPAGGLAAPSVGPATREEPVYDPSVDGSERTVVRVEGMDCASCAVTVERRVATLPGVHRATVNFAAGRLDAEHVPGLGVREIEGAVRAAGFEVGGTGKADGTPFWRTPRALLTAASALLFLVGLVLGLAGAPDVARVGVYLAAILVGGLPIFRAALAGLRARHLDMNVLMSVATVGAVGIGEWAEAASVVVLFAAGNALQIYAINRTRGAVRALAKLAPDEVLVRRDGPAGYAEVVVGAGEVGVGEVLVIRPGERLAVDGVVIEGRSTVDEAPVTGESVPAEKGPNDAVYSGTVNGSGGLLVRATKRAGDSTLQSIVRLVEEAQAKKAPAEQLVDRFSRVYTPVVVGIALLLAAVPTVLGASFEEWFYRALALLIIACPCALVISTPVTVVSGIGAASRRGILVKGGAALESAGRIRALAFDKTGTLTEGRPVVSRVVALDGTDETEAVGLAAALERRSEHPLAHAILTAALGYGIDALPQVAGFRSVAGRGAEGEVGGKRYAVGSPRLFAEAGISLEGARAALEEVGAAGETPVVLGDEHVPLAVFGLSDAVRPDARATVEALREAGVEELVMLTGDADAPARRTAEALGIRYEAGLLPADKVEAVQRLVAEHGSVGMVGDGVNDAPALAAASVGFAMGAAGTDVALETADVALMQDDLPKLVEAVRLSRSAERIIRQNILFSVVVKGLFVLLAPFGLVALWLAVLADMGTSIAVTLNGLRLFRSRG